MTTPAALFQTALNVGAPWEVTRVEFAPADTSPAAGELHLHLDFPRGSHFPCPTCATPCSVYDTTPDRVWRHLNFWQHPTFLHARLPRVSCAACGVLTVAVPWARPECGFTLLFEAFVLTLARQMPAAAVARLVGAHDTCLWRLLAHYLDDAYAAADWSEVRELGFDETAIRGREFVTLGVDLEQARVLTVTPGRDRAAIQASAAAFQAHGGQPEAVETVSIDLSPAFQRGVREEFPKSRIVFDRFHVMQLVNDALDAVRRAEAKGHLELKGTRYWWLKNPEDLTPKERAGLEALLGTPLQTVGAYRWKLAFQQLWEQPDPETARRHLQQLLNQMNPETPEPMLRLAGTLDRARAGILAYYAAPVTNGLLEGINSLVQAVKARARGYRNDRYFARMIHLVAGKLLPTAAT